MTNHFKTSLNMFLLYHLFIEIVLWTDLESLSRRASVSALLTCTRVSLVKKKLIRHITSSRGIPVTMAGNVSSEDNQHWDYCGISKMNNGRDLSSPGVELFIGVKTMFSGLLLQSPSFLPNRNIWSIVFKSRYPPMILHCHWPKELRWSGRTMAEIEYCS